MAQQTKDGESLNLDLNSESFQEEILLLKSRGVKE
jgi:hypothetical protein